jgi:tetratricopeptide (TPR) repeat protein
MSRCASCDAELPDGGDCPRCVTQASDATIVDGNTPAAGAIPKRIAHFTIVRELGAGGMGTVYLAHDEKMRRDVALKVLSRHSSWEAAARRFEQEAWLAGRLDHPNIVKVYERGQWEELSYYAMELMDGGSLADVIEHQRRSGGDPDRKLVFGSSEAIHWALRTTIDAARALDAAHRQGIVHRDIKPVNLLLNRAQSAVKIADFGIAVDLEATRMTATGTVLGTVLYMAPEQIRGETSKIDGRTDVYALGVTLFELLTLEMPYTGKTQQLYMSQVLTTDSRRARGLNARVSRDVETVLRKAMEKDPADRYATAGAFADDLDNVLHLRPITARPVGAIRRAAKWARRKPVHAALLATLAIAIPAAGYFAQREVRERAEGRRRHLADLLDEAVWLGQRTEYGAMLERATAALTIEPGNLMALRHRAMARFRLAGAQSDSAATDGLRAAALADVDVVIAGFPLEAWPHRLKALMLTDGKQEEAAKSEIERAEALRKDPPSDEDVAESARLAQAQGEKSRAVELYSELIRRHPDSVLAISARARMYEALGKPDQALVDYRVAVGLDPKYKLTLIDLARLALDQGLIDDAEATLKRALEVDPEYPFALEEQGRVLAKRAEQAKVKGDLAKARALYESAEKVTRDAVERSSSLLWPELNLGGILAERAKLSSEIDPVLMGRAIEAYQKVIAGFDGPPQGGQRREIYVAAHLNLCDAQIALRRLREALQTCAQVTELSPDDAAAQYNLAGAYALSGDAPSAFAALSKDVALGDADWEYLEAEPWFTTLRKDPRFTAIVAEMKRKGAGAKSGS